MAYQGECSNEGQRQPSRAQDGADKALGELPKLAAGLFQHFNRSISYRIRMGQIVRGNRMLKIARARGRGRLALGQRAGGGGCVTE